MFVSHQIQESLENILFCDDAYDLFMVICYRKHTDAVFQHLCGSFFK